MAINTNELDYDLVWAIEYFSRILDSFATDTSSGVNPYFEGLGVDLNREYDKYYNILYKLCEIAVKQGVVDDIRLEMDATDAFYFNEIVDEIDYSAQDRVHEGVMDSIEIGDKVRLYNGSVRYVADIDGRSLWVTMRKGDSDGWAADIDDVEEIIEKYEG